MAGNKEKLNKEQMAQIDKNYQDRLKPNHINNYVNWKWTKLTYKKVEIVRQKRKAQVYAFHNNYTLILKTQIV